MDKPTAKEIEEYMQKVVENVPADKPSYNPITKPKHYMVLEGVEVRDICEALVRKLSVSIKTPVADSAPLFESDYVQMMQYLMRFMDKNGKEDLEKASFYLDKMIKAY